MFDEALKLPLCDRCLGRQFKSKFPNLDCEKIGKKIRKKGIGVGCEYCGDTYTQIPSLIKIALKKLKGIEFVTFWCGTRISKEILSKEERIWEKIGIAHCEPIKRDLLRELGGSIEKETGKKARLENPDLTITFDFIKKDVEITIWPLFIYGKYRKLVRGIPQTKWLCIRCKGGGCKKCGGKGRFYDESVEEIIGEKILKKTKGVGTKFHGLGREDIDARCLGKRPFVIEILKPLKRKLDFGKLEKEINKFAGGKVEVSDLKDSDMEEVRLIKKLKLDKRYRALIESDSEINEEDIEKILKIKGKTLSQRTPERVAHRRADLVRKRKVIDLKVTKIDKKEIDIEIETEAGTYIKELISGDSGRTKPSFAEATEKNMVCKELDVIEIKER